jgi:hypothetical protein
VSEHPGPSQPQPPPRPRWVKVSLIVAVAVIALIVVVMAIVGGEHGPGRHSLGGNPEGHALPVEHSL